MNSHPDFYAGKRVAVTGGLGFVGSVLSRKLVDLGAEVYILDNGSHNIVDGIEGATLLPVDVGNMSGCDWGFRRGSTRGTPVNVVFNLAASVAGVLHNMGHHSEMFESNIRLQTVPVAVADTLGIPVFVQTSSVCIYDPENNHPSFEEHGHLGAPDRANAGYGWAKRMGEHALKFSGINRWVVVRPSNVFGPGDHFDDKAHVIPALMKRAVHDESIAAYGSPSYIREFIYVDDVADGMIAAGANGVHETAYNIGCDGRNAIDMGDLARLIATVCGEKNKKVVWNKSVGGGDPLRWSDTTLAETDLGWRYSVSLRDGLKQTFDWAKGNGVV